MGTPTDQPAQLVPVRITVEYDDDFTPDDWDESLREEVARKLDNHELGAYSVIVRAVGPVEREASLHGCVVELTDIGVYKDAAEIPDAHLREVATSLIGDVRDSYLADLVQSRDEINALIARLEQDPNSK
ncbi:hypothetical protein [Streptomyces sp. 061-3]|uniref:hypothetical protein n=1 Tax=Streptomyces sp. 061-3 TaxID=2789268 RepID=UPI003980D442